MARNDRHDAVPGLPGSATAAPHATLGLDRRQNAPVSGDPGSTRDDGRRGGPVASAGTGLRVAVYVCGAGADRGRSIDRQIRTCVACLAGMGLTPHAVFVDPHGRHGGRGPHRELARLLDACDRGEYAMIVVEDHVRFMRRVEDAGLCAGRLDQSGVRLHCAASAREIHAASLVIAAFQAEQDRARRRIPMAVGRSMLVESGGVPHGCPFGYRRGATAGFPVIDPRQAAIVRRIFALADGGRSSRGIAEVLAGEGALGPSGTDRWTADTVRRILRQPLYAGRVVYGRTERRFDRATGRTIVRRRRPEDVLTMLVEAYRIVSDTLFLRIAAARKRRRRS